MIPNLIHHRRARLLTCAVVLPTVASIVSLSGYRVAAGEPDGVAASKLSVATAQVKDLDWMEGTWRSLENTSATEERWSGPLGNSMVGTLRWLRNDQVWRYELMTISKDSGRLVFRLKHFSRKLASWEEKDEALSFSLTQIEANKVVFKNDKYEETKRVTFYRPVPETLIVRFEGTKDGEPTLNETQFSRVGR